MQLQVIPGNYSICKVKTAESLAKILFEKSAFCLCARTAEELSLLCQSALVPKEATAREDGWRGFRIRGQLDFALTGILAPIAALLAEAEIPIFAASTFNTDYVFIKEASFEKAMTTLEEAGYTIDP